jgi:outer membrane protein OmpA-like peptidoglycan-associated protein
MNRSYLLLFAGVSVLAACSTPKPDAALTQAEAQVNTAANDADVVNYANPQLQTAQQSLSQANAALKDGDTAGEDHYAFLASRYAQTAEQIARQKKAQQVVQAAPLTREQVLRQNAQAEAERARQQAAQQTEQARQQAAAAEQRAKAEAEAARSKQGLVLTPRDILFQPGQATLDARATAELHQVADYLKANPDRRVLIEGFTDSTGSATLNEQLSKERADAVRLALAGDGVDPSRIEIRGMGPSEPIASNGNVAGRLLNRRVAIVISNADGSFPAAAQQGSSIPRGSPPSRQ